MDTKVEKELRYIDISMDFGCFKLYFTESQFFADCRKRNKETKDFGKKKLIYDQCSAVIADDLDHESENFVYLNPQN